jgi:hypothetical protein
MIYAHHFFASSGVISGVGLANAKTIGSVAIVFISSAFRRFHLLTQMKMFASFIASFNVQEILFLL